MLGRVARVLRIMGFDTEFFRDEEDMRILARCLRERRILITADRELYRLAKGWGLKVILTSPHRIDPWKFSEALLKALGIEDCKRPFVRCPRCNGELVEVDREELVGFVHPYVWNRKEKFAVCKECGQIYWEGTHVERMRRRLQED